MPKQVPLLASCAQGRNARVARVAQVFCTLGSGGASGPLAPEGPWSPLESRAQEHLGHYFIYVYFKISLLFDIKN